MIPQYSVFLAICNPTVSLIGAFLSILIIVILSNKGFKEIFYVYLKFQAYFTLFNLLIKIFQPLLLLIKVKYQKKNLINIIMQHLYFYLFFSKKLKNISICLMEFV